MADSSTYTPETIARRYAMAQQLLAEPKQPVRHWAEGLNELAKGALGGYQQNEAENLERRSRADANSQIAAALGLPAPAPVADNPSGFAKIAALFNPKSSDAPIQSDAPTAPVFRGNSQGAPVGMAPPIPSAAIPVADRIVNAESGGDPNAKNPRSSATGAGQFIDSTWLDTVKKSNPQLASGKTDAELLALRSNPDISRDMTAAYAASNGDHLKNNGIDPTPGNTYLAHFAGPAGATAILKADPATPIGSIVGQQAMIANPFLKNMTAGDLRSWADKRMGGGNPLANAPTVDGNGPSPLDTAQYPAGPVGAPNAGGATTLSAQSAQPVSAPPPIQTGPAPGILGGQSSAAATPPVGPTGAAPAGLAGNPNAAKIAALLTNPWIDPSVKTQVLTQLNPTYGFQTLPDGTILRTNPKTGTVEPIYSAPVKPELKETGSDPITGQKSFQVFDPKTQTMRPVSGVDGATPQQTGGLLAPGVKALDRSLTGDDYLGQFAPEVQAAVKAYIRGDVMPTGNARKDSIATQAKTIAQKYGQDVGIPVSDATYSQRRTYQSQLGSNSPNSSGGQAKAFNQGIEHMGHLADTLEKLDNSNGLGIPMVANAVNAVRQGVSTDQSAISDKASSIGQTLAGEVGKLFSGSAGGGVHERELTRERFSTVKSKPQLAAALEGTLEMMRGGLTALEQRRDEVMGPNSGIRFVNPETEAKIAKIQESIDRLKGGTPSPQGTNPQPTAAEKTINGKTYYKFGPNPTDWAEK